MAYIFMLLVVYVYFCSFMIVDASLPLLVLTCCGIVCCSREFDPALQFAVWC